jgi:hypothetical protein
MTRCDFEIAAPSGVAATPIAEKVAALANSRTQLTAPGHAVATGALLATFGAGRVPPQAAPMSAAAPMNAAITGTRSAAPKRGALWFCGVVGGDLCGVRLAAGPASFHLAVGVCP